MKLCFATQNPNKIREISDKLNAISNNLELVDLQSVGCIEELAEDQLTFEGNAFQKANYVSKNHYANCFADDSGLEVEALNGEPGIYSARYAGDHKNYEDNIRLLLTKLQGKPNRNARFRTCLCLILNGITHYFEGITEGKIIEQARGTGGFAYDCIFVPNGYDQTFAELDLASKNKISHRALALEKLVNFLKTV